MTLRWRYYLAVVPLMLGLGVASALVLVHLVRQEAAWGMQQRAEGVAASLAEFLPMIEVVDTAEQRRLLADVARRLGPATLSVHAWPYTNAPPRWLHAGAGIEVPQVPAEALAELAARGLSWRQEQEGTSALSIGHALAYGPDGLPRALVSVAEQDDTLAQSMRALRGELVWVAGLLFALGCAIAEWLTRGVQRELATLASAAAALEAGGQAGDWQAGRIQEINDLGGTLQTMGSLLADGVQRIRQGFFETESIPTRQSIALHVQRRHVLRLRARALPDGVAWCVLGEPGAEHLLDWQMEATGWTAVIGLLPVVGDSDPLEASLYGRALGRLALQVESQVFAGAPEFVDTRLIRLHATSDGIRSEFSGTSLHRAAHTAPTLRQIHGTLDAEAMHVARMYLLQTTDRPLAQVVAELEALLGARYSGFLWACEGRIAADA